MQMGKNLATTYSRSKKWVRSYQTSQLFFDLCQVTNTKPKFFQAILLEFKTCLNRRLSMKTKCLRPNSKQLIALSQKNKIVCFVPSYIIFQNLPRFSTSNKFHFWTCASEHKLEQVLFHKSLLMVLVRLNEKMQR